jgi:histidine ammonia-lyase
VDSIPTSANREDHVSMGMTSARKAVEVIKNTRACLAIELMVACQAIDLVGLSPGKGASAAHRAIRAVVPHHDRDRVLADDIAKVDALIADGTIRRAVEAEVGPLA